MNATAFLGTAVSKERINDYEEGLAGKKAARVKTVDDYVAKYHTLHKVTYYPADPDHQNLSVQELGEKDDGSGRWMCDCESFFTDGQDCACIMSAWVL